MKRHLSARLNALFPDTRQGRLDLIESVVEIAVKQLPASVDGLQRTVNLHSKQEPRKQSERVQGLVRAMLATVKPIDHNVYNALDGGSGALAYANGQCVVTVWVIRFGTISFRPTSAMLLYFNG
jgi:hypothetical protein